MAPTAQRAATSWLNYPGDHRHLVDGPPMGPNLFGELLYPVTADFDGERTRVGFSLIAPEAGAR